MTVSYSTFNYNFGLIIDSCTITPVQSQITKNLIVGEETSALTISEMFTVQPNNQAFLLCDITNAEITSLKVFDQNEVESTNKIYASNQNVVFDTTAEMSLT